MFRSTSATEITDAAATVVAGDIGCTGRDCLAAGTARTERWEAEHNSLAGVRSLAEVRSQGTLDTGEEAEGRAFRREMLDRVDACLVGHCHKDWEPLLHAAERLEVLKGEKKSDEGKDEEKIFGKIIAAQLFIINKLQKRQKGIMSNRSCHIDLVRSYLNFQRARLEVKAIRTGKTSESQ